MEAYVLSSDFPDICKWCGKNNAQIVFENAFLCNDCSQKALWAAQNSKLCGLCSNLLTQEQNIRKLFTEYGLGHALASGLQRSSEEGCGLCRMLLLQDTNPDPGRLQFIPLYLHARKSGRANLTAEMSYKSAGDINSLTFSSEPGQYTLDLAISAFENNPASKFISQRPPEENLANERTNQQIRDWLDECLTEHPESLSADKKSPLPSQQLPTRVIDVGLGPESEIRLFEPSSTVHDHYITLSYRWGEQHFLTTTIENIDSHKQKLEFLTLPQTFQDAIITTRNLGFRYLWIDALCIIQNSNKDKAKEISIMGDIYNNSTLTIAAVSTQSVGEGFLRTKPLLSVNVPYLCPDGTMGSVRVSPQKTADLWQESLYTRGWCLQENVLSPRLLLYTDTEVIWQCETCPIKRPDTTHVSYLYENPQFGASPFRRLPADMLKPIEVDPEAKDSSIDSERYQIWKSLVQNYTRRNLSVAADRLPALAGIAQKLGEAWSDTYLAGIWERQLVPSLTWRRSNLRPQPHYPPLSEYRAPSWSWASIDGPVEFDMRFDIGNTRGLQVKALSCVFDLSSELRDTLTLEASLISIDGIPNPDASGMGIFFLDDDPENIRPNSATYRIKDLNEEMKSICKYMLLGEGRYGTGKMMKTIALVLMPVDGEDEDTFSRIGLYESSRKGFSKLWVGSKNRRTVKII